MWLLALLPIGMGALLGAQTAINAKLRGLVGSPYLASAISFTIGTAALAIVAFSQGALVGFHWTGPWWLWLGGLFGTIGLTMNILLFPKLGSVQTAVLPIFGQIVASALIDQLGAFFAPVHPLTLVKGGGLVLVVVGVLTTVMGPTNLIRTPVPHRLWWQLGGIGAGMLMASQIAINGHLGTVQHSALAAATYSFASGAALLWLLCLGKRVPLTAIKAATQQGPRAWWIWLGGLFGAVYVFGSTWLVTLLGTGQIVVLVLFGQLTTSAVIEHFGFLGSVKAPVARQKVLGLIIMFIGVVLTKLA